MRLLKTILVGIVLAGLPVPAAAQAESSVEPFALGTFDINGRETVAIVLRNSLVVELDAANRHLEMHGPYGRVAMAGDMLDLIGQYEYGLKFRLYEIVNHLVGSGQLSGSSRPGFIHDVGAVRTLAPIRYPGKILNAAGNFYSHVCEGCSPEEQAASDAKFRANRSVPYLFLKPGRGAIIGNGDAVVIPAGRDRTDWEVELAAIIGRPARYVSATDARNYVFGYSIMVDISDRGGHPNPRRTSDWFVGKGHETFAPFGPWIVPSEFYGDPMERLHQQLTIDGVTVQEAKAGDMIHSIWELIEYGSSIITLHPGDVINSGTSGGTSSGAFAEGTRTGYLQPGESFEATIEGIGTLRHPVVAGPPLPDNLTGSQLPAISTYRKD
jgi:2-keto-4-pentenoate hydratase/2-oxohepta-3-ene-1,7-dioic acid hydratase in catechol pathway